MTMWHIEGKKRSKKIVMACDCSQTLKSKQKNHLRRGEREKNVNYYLSCWTNSFSVLLFFTKERRGGENRGNFYYISTHNKFIFN